MELYLWHYIGLLSALQLQFYLFSIDGNNIGNTVSAKLETAIKSKCSHDEIVELLKEIPDEDAEQQTNPLRVNNIN